MTRHTCAPYDICPRCEHIAEQRKDERESGYYADPDGRLADGAAADDWARREGA